MFLFGYNEDKKGSRFIFTDLNWLVSQFPPPPNNTSACHQDHHRDHLITTVGYYCQFICYGSALMTERFVTSALRLDWIPPQVGLTHLKMWPVSRAALVPKPETNALQT